MEDWVEDLMNSNDELRSQSIYQHEHDEDKIEISNTDFPEIDEVCFHMFYCIIVCRMEMGESRGLN